MTSKRLSIEEQIEKERRKHQAITKSEKTVEEKT